MPTTFVDQSGATPGTALNAASLNGLVQGLTSANLAANAGILAGQIASVNAAALIIPACRCYNSANLSIANNTFTALTFDSNRYDQGAGGAVQHSTSSNTSRLVCQVAGVYKITGGVSYASNATGGRELLIRLNGTTYIQSLVVQANGAATFPTDLSITTDYLLSVNDYVELVVFQTSGGALNVLAQPNYSPEFMMSRVG